MAVRTIQQIQKELAVGDKSQRALINKQLKELPKLFQGQVKGLEAKQKNAFADILSGAKQRGLKFSGIPLAEQAEYTSDVFLPALAGLEEQRNTARTGLQGALADIIAQRSAMAQQLRQQELDRDFAREQAIASRRAAAAQQSSIADLMNAVLGGGGGGDQTKPASNKELIKQAQSDAQAYAQRVSLAAQNNPNINKNQLLMANKEAADKGSVTAMARYNALSKLLGFDAGYNISTGKFSPGSSRFYNMSQPGVSGQDRTAYEKQADYYRNLYAPQKWSNF